MAIAAFVAALGVGQRADAQRTSAPSDFTTKVDDVVGDYGCSTQGVEGLSAQLAAQMLCYTWPQLTKLEHRNITLASERVFPYLSNDGAAALFQAADEHPVTINSSYRTIVDQYMLHNTCKVAAAPGRSNHETGRAIDVNYSSTLNSVLVAHQFLHPFPSNDKVHYEHGGPDLRPYSALAFQKLWNQNHPDDRLPEDGVVTDELIDRLGRAPANGFESGPSCPTCVPNPEECNGLDDDCDGFADNGCYQGREDAASEPTDENAEDLSDTSAGCSVGREQSAGGVLWIVAVFAWIAARRGRK